MAPADMVEAELLIFVSDPDTSAETPPARYELDGWQLRRAVSAIDKLADLRWTIVLDRYGLLSSGRLWWTACKRFDSMQAALNELLSLGEFQERQPDHRSMQRAQPDVHLSEVVGADLQLFAGLYYAMRPDRPEPGQAATGPAGGEMRDVDAAR